MGKIQINHIQCETFPLHEGSLRGLCKRVYYTPKSIDRCPFCRNALTTRYVYYDSLCLFWKYQLPKQTSFI